MMYPKTLALASLLFASVFADQHGGYGGGNDAVNRNAENSGNGGNGGKPDCTKTADAGVASAVPQVAAPSQAAAGETMVQVVSVSDQSGSLKYFPDNIQAPVGSIVQFQFHPKNHTVTESLFNQPCKPRPAENNTAERPGVRSGFVPVKAEDTNIPVYSIMINDTKPIWLYCAQGAHCQGGMVMVINQNLTSPDKTLEKYREAAALVAKPPAPPVSSAATSAAATSAAPAVSSAPPSTFGVATVASVTTSARASAASAGTPSVQPFTGAASPLDIGSAGYFVLGLGIFGAFF